MTARASIVLCLLLLCGCVSRNELLPQAQSVYAPPPSPWDALPENRAKATVNHYVVLGWDAVSDASVTGYNLYYGTNSRSYSGFKPVSVPATSVGVSNLVSGNTYYFAVTAKNSSGLESSYSSEVSYTAGPKPLTNYIHIASVWVTNLTQQVGVTNWSVTLTNPVGTRFYRHDIKEETR